MHVLANSKKLIGGTSRIEEEDRRRIYKETLISIQLGVQTRKFVLKDHLNDQLQDESTCYFFEDK